MYVVAELTFVVDGGNGVDDAPILASDWIIAPCMTTVPEPMDAYLEIIADGWTAVVYTNGYPFAISSINRLWDDLNQSSIQSLHHFIHLRYSYIF